MLENVECRMPGTTEDRCVNWTIFNVLFEFVGPFGDRCIQLLERINIGMSMVDRLVAQLNNMAFQFCMFGNETAKC